MRFYPFIFSIFYFGGLFSQTDYVAIQPPRNYGRHPSTNVAFIELGGNAGLFSLNFERLYYYKEKFKISGRAGFAPVFNGIYIEQTYVLENNFILFNNPHHLELGIGLTMERRYNQRPGIEDAYFWENILFSIWRCGYRYQKQDDSFFLKAGMTPAIMSHDALGFHPDYFMFWAGAGIGLSF